MISTRQPADFNPRYEVASCFVEREGQILLLLRLPDKSEGNKWGVPAGKIETNETPLETIVRELAEETGLVVARQAMRPLETFYIRYPEYDYVYHVFHTQISPQRQAQTNPQEHQGFRWATPEQALQLELVKHQDDCVKFFYLNT